MFDFFRTFAQIFAVFGAFFAVFTRFFAIFATFSVTFLHFFAVFKDILTKNGIFWEHVLQKLT
jgi:ABC-type Na+ efflux pump permease subunit